MLLVYSAKAQQRCQWVKYGAKISDTLTIIPSSVKSPQTGSLHLEHFPSGNQIQILPSDSLQKDSLFICYEVLPFSITQPFYKRKIIQIDSLTLFTEPLITKKSTLEEDKEEFFVADSLQKTGSILRGITFGNQQNAFVNSSLNLQLDGKLGEDLDITAVISDQNVPFQPEGNTQQLQQFDRVYIQLSKKKSRLTVGDIVFQNKPGSHFLRYYKNVQGGQFENNYRPQDSAQANTLVGIATAKGKFSSINLSPIEGVQGPYRLQGPNNERFIIVLANSEKVFVDGKLLTRGFDYDYIIDYNLAEITFNINILITQYTRIRVDFEYAERNYGRTTWQAAHRQKLGKTEVFLQHYAEIDNPRNPLLLNLSDSTQKILSEIGDDLNRAVRPAFDSLGFDEGQIRYARKDTITPQGTFRNIFFFSQNPSEAIYQVRFSEVGSNRGNYRLSGTLGNGRVYEWIAPINDIPQGDFEPIELVPTPQKRQLTVAGAQWNLSSKSRLSLEIGFSQRDQNRFSSLDDQDNNGLASLISYQIRNQPSFIKNWNWLGDISYEFNNPLFQPIDRYRPIEFNRDWNLNLDTLAILPPATEHLLSTQIGLQKDPDNLLVYKIVYRNRDSLLSGYQHYLLFNKNIGKFYWKNQAFLLDASQPFQNYTSRWKKVSSDFAHLGKKIIKGYIYSLDKNLVKTTNDSVVFSAMYFDEHKLYVKQGDSLEKLSFSADYAFRTDSRPIEGKLHTQTIAQTWQARVQSSIFQTQFITLLGSYRKIQNIPVNLSEENIMSRLDWTSFFWKKNIRSELILQTVTARELRREFSYIQVPTGQGTHTWRDVNNNSVQELNEFYLAINPDEKQYIKVFTPTDEYIPAFSGDLNYRLNIKMPAAWKQQKSLKKLLSKVSNTSSWVIRRKSTDSFWLSRILPFIEIPDNTILSIQENLRSTFFYDQGNPAFGLEAALNRTTSRQLLTQGFEKRLQEEWQATLRRNVGRYLNAQLTLRQQNINNNSDFLVDRNFDVQSYFIIPSLALQPSPEFRVTTGYVYANKQNKFIIETAENLQWHEISAELRWNRLSEQNILTTFRWIQINFTGSPNTPVGYEMLEALVPGQNMVWGLQWQQRLANGLQVSLSYDGRKSPEIPVVHLGRMQVGILF